MGGIRCASRARPATCQAWPRRLGGDVVVAEGKAYAEERLAAAIEEEVLAWVNRKRARLFYLGIDEDADGDDDVTTGM